MISLVLLLRPQRFFGSLLDASLYRLINILHSILHWLHRSRGDSGQLRGSRTDNAAISNALVDGATLECEKYRRFKDLSEKEIKRMSLQSYKGYEKKRMEKNALYTYAVRLPRGLMTPLFLKTTLRLKWVSLLRNCSFSILLILIDNGVNQEETNWNSLVQLTSERSNRLWKTTTVTSVESS